jgi:hypothetical protein
MKKRLKLIVFFSLGFVLLLAAVLTTHFWIERNNPQKRILGFEKSNGIIRKVTFDPASDPDYRNACGGCHLPYPPGLMPGASWRMILERLPDHFGEQLLLDPRTKERLTRYLTENGADRSSAKTSVKIMRSLNGQIPSRITEIPLFQKKHRGIGPEIINRKSIGSFSNCSACHRTAEQGNFNEHQVVIPN